MNVSYAHGNIQWRANEISEAWCVYIRRHRALLRRRCSGIYMHKHILYIILYACSVIDEYAPYRWWISYITRRIEWGDAVRRAVGLFCLKDSDHGPWKVASPIRPPTLVRRPISYISIYEVSVYVGTCGCLYHLLLYTRFTMCYVRYIFSSSRWWSYFLHRGFLLQ